MDKLTGIAVQRRFWNEWNSSHGARALQPISARQAEVVAGWLDALGRRNLDILEVGCGSGWFSPMLAAFGNVRATDLSDRVLARAETRTPEVAYVAGDFMDLDFGSACFDAVVTLEVLSHVADQAAFLAKIARHLRPGGHLMLATQNRYVLQRFNRIPPPAVGQLRRWVDRDELRQLLEPHFAVLRLFSVSPKADHGFMRLINARQLNRPIRALLGDRVERLKESIGLGWTLMALARRLPRFPDAR